MTERVRYGSTAVRIYRMLFDPLISPLRPRVTSLCQTLDVNTALDIACGTGAQCRSLARTGISATGLDLSPEMVERARRQGGSRTSYVQGTAYSLPFGSAAFDASLLLLALHEHTEDERTQMLLEAFRVARSHVIVADYQPPGRPRMSPAWQAIRLVETLAGPEHREGFRGFVQGGGLAGLLERHGCAARPVTRSHLGTIQLMLVSKNG